ncbi:hypothetical protein DFH94DRAFT_106436 [Russula ochroleuca]|uniref:Uncharacterized protein n=1 Tax=Russula ochroleuca TaxID=152965 RepID=A0A9P5MM19_9AGAM|nr:hypothetical protein DFH94DRAFT_106436 [Russula ochroleuca]
MDKTTPTPPNLNAVISRPATPQHVLNNNLLQSTPSNNSSAYTAEHLTSALPSTFANIEKHENCTVEILLNSMLSICLPEENKHSAPADLLGRCLNAVLPICNGNVNVRSHLKEFTSCQRHPVERYRSDETVRYGPFVYAFNHALQALREIDVPLRPLCNDRLLFHKKDPEHIAEEHNGHRSRHKPSPKPNIIIVSLDATRNAFKLSEGDDSASWADFALKTSASSPKKRFEWKDFFSAVELEQIKPELPPPSEKYFVKTAKIIPPQPIPISLHETLYEDLRTQPSKDAMPKPPKSDEP